MHEHDNLSEPDLGELLEQGRLGGIVPDALWTGVCKQLAAGQLDLLGLWGDTDLVHMAVWAPQLKTVSVISYACTEGTFPSVARIHTPADRLERTITDLFGLKPVNPHDTRLWLNHGKWGINHPLGLPLPSSGVAPYTFLPVEGESLHHIPVGPVHAGIIEPGFFRFTANGETVVRLEERLGYVHKGVESLLNGTTPEHGVKLAGRVSGDSTVAYSIAYARAVEDALSVKVPPRALWLRALMAEMERIANHLGDIGAVCNDAAFALMLAHCGILREQVMRTAQLCFGHRFMKDIIVPGGITVDVGAQELPALQALVEAIEARFPALIDLYDNTASLQDRTVSTGILKPELAARFAAGGHVGRASGRDFDCRRSPGYAPYDSLTFEVPVRSEGDVNARVWIRILEVEQSLSLMKQILARLPEGRINTPLPAITEAVEGFALAESFRGDVLVWLRLGADGRIERCHLRDPSWFQWPLLEAVIENNIVADFPLCNKSFNCSYSGHDL